MSCITFPRVLTSQPLVSFFTPNLSPYSRQTAPPSRDSRKEMGRRTGGLHRVWGGKRRLLTLIPRQEKVPGFGELLRQRSRRARFCSVAAESPTANRERVCLLSVLPCRGSCPLVP